MAHLRLDNLEFKEGDVLRRYILMNQVGKRREVSVNPPQLGLDYYSSDHDAPIYRCLSLRLRNARAMDEEEELLLVFTSEKTTNLEPYHQSSKILCPIQGPLLHASGLSGYTFPPVAMSIRTFLKDFFGDGGMPEENIMLVMKVVVEGVKFLHEMGIVHGKLSLSHVYVMEKAGVIRLGYGLSAMDLDKDYPQDEPLSAEDTMEMDLELDLGIAEALDLEEFNEDFCASTYLWALPPESEDLKATDIWCLGVMALELAYGTFEVADETALTQVLEEIKSHTSRPMKKSKNLSQEFISFVTACLEQDAADRPTIQQISELNLFSQATSE